MSSPEKTVNITFFNPAHTMELSDGNLVKTTPQTIVAQETFAQQSIRALEIASFVIALMHNWSQCIYLNNQQYSSFSNYILSGNFLM